MGWKKRSNSSEAPLLVPHFWRLPIESDSLALLINLSCACKQARGSRKREIQIMRTKREHHKLVLTNRRKKAEFIKYIKRDSASYSLYVLRQCVTSITTFLSFFQKFKVNTKYSLIIICLIFHVALHCKQFLASYKAKRSLQLANIRLGRSFYGV